MSSVVSSIKRRSLLSTTTSLCPAVLGFALLTTAAQAQTASHEAARPAAETEGTVIVTGSRIVRDGYDAPTPTTVLGVEEIRRMAPLNLAESINQLPALVGSTRNNSSTISAGLVGINALNLRNLGPTRTLVLFDGQRMPAATTGGLIDASIIPDALVKRVDVVTGGASAAWGSDAVAGVVNYVLDKEFTGLRGEVSGGITTYGDDPNYRVTLAGGTNFAGGRGHIMANVEQVWNKGVQGLPRDWYVGAKQLNNPDYTPTNGQPRILTRRGVGYTTVAPGAIITSGPLRGIYFGEGGAPAQLNFGEIVSDPFMVGGDWRVTDFGNGPQALSSPTVRQNAFVRASYELADNVTAFGQLSYSRTNIDMITTPMFNFGGLTIHRDNPFIPVSIGEKMDDHGLSSFDVGTWNKDIGGLPYKANRELYRYVAGLEGSFNIGGGTWSWDAAYTRNVSDIQQELYIPINANYRRALDAVMGPDGVPICRSTLTDPTNGCAPFNLLGTGTASTAALNYVNGTAWLDMSIKQDIFNANISGDLFDLGAGPVALAAGFEHRREKSSGNSDELSKVNSYWAGNFKALNGAYNVTEGYAEIAVPLLRDTAFAHRLDLTGAVRFTNYSTSGSVATWKVGGSWAPIEDIKFRVTRSRDIRAGNMAELFQPGQTLTSTFSDPYFEDRRSYAFFYTTVGNASIAPEKADTLNLGVVFQPTFLPGFTASADFWDIKLKDAISTMGVGTMINECLTGNTNLCQYIKRDAGGYITDVTLVPVNLAQQQVRGIDLEAGYRVALGEGQLSLRALATRFMRDRSFSGIQGARWNDNLNVGTPEWRYMFTAAYTAETLSLSVSARGMSDRVLSNSYIECQTNCPTSTTLNPTIDNNHVDGFFYVDTSASYKFKPQMEAFIAVSNLFNKDPAIIPNGMGIGSQQRNLNETFYDLMGRAFRVGVRFSI